MPLRCRSVLHATRTPANIAARHVHDYVGRYAKELLCFPCYTPVRTGFAAAAVGRTALWHASSSGAGTPAARESAHQAPPAVDRQRAAESPDRHAL